MESIACAQDGPETGGRPTKLRDDTISKNKWIHFFNVFRMPQNHNKHRRRGGRSKGFKHTAVTVVSAAASPSLQLTLGPVRCLDAARMQLQTHNGCHSTSTFCTKNHTHTHLLV